MSLWHDYYRVNLTDEQKDALEQAAVLAEALPDEVWEAFDDDEYTPQTFVPKLIRYMKKFQPDDDLSELHYLMEILYKMGHREIPRLVLPATGFKLDMCEADWTADMERGE